MHPILSVIIPLYNCEPFIKPCLDSILAQPLAPSDYEVIIVDDGSTDQSVAVASGYAARHGHIHLIRQENQGVACARNRALQAASGDYVTFVDSDDELSPNTLQPLMQMLHEHPEYDILEYSVLQNVGSGHECPLTLNNHLYHNARDWLSVNGCSHCWMWKTKDVRQSQVSCRAKKI